MRGSAWRGSALASAVVLLVLGCGGKGIDTAPTATTPGTTTSADCSPPRLNQAVLDTARQWYLFPETLPASIDPAAYATVGDFLNALTTQARVEGKDRFFSGVTSIATENALLQGTTAGFGFTLLESASPAALRVAQVFAGSAAADAGFVRGDALLEVGTSPTTLQPIDQILASTGGLEQAIGPSTAGIVRTLRWRTLAGETRTATLTKRSFELDAVPAANVRLLTLTNGNRIGHLTFRSFVSDPVASGASANLAALRAAFAQFAAAGVRDVVIDLRYNGGGLVSVGGTLASYVAGGRGSNRVFATLLFNDRQAGTSNSQFNFSGLASALGASRVYVLTGPRTCSASEQVINGLRGVGIDVVAIGDTTCGKPVGFQPASQCGTTYSVVNFESVNERFEGRYFDGFAPTCAVADDLSRALGAPDEALLSAAASFADNGVCPAPASGASSRTLRRQSPRAEAGERQDMLAR